MPRAERAFVEMEEYGILRCAYRAVRAWLLAHPELMSGEKVSARSSHLRGFSSFAHRPKRMT